MFSSAFVENKQASFFASVLQLCRQTDIFARFLEFPGTGAAFRYHAVGRPFQVVKMYAYIEGKLTEQNPACVTIDCGGVGYEVNISLHTYEQIKGKEKVRLWIYQAVREDALTFFGFAEKMEKELFLQLISVSGIGANTARVILSTLSPAATVQAILDGDVKKIQTVKGIGLKSAQRLIVDLRDKVGKLETGSGPVSFLPAFSEERQEAVAALITLGFAKNTVEKTVDGLMAKMPDLKTEELIKQALRML